MSYDAIVAGGSYAGLSAAIHLARARRRVFVVDGARPRNRFSERSHGVLAQDGRPGREMLDAARAQVGAYPAAILRTGFAIAARPHAGGFAVELDDGTSVQGRGLILATGVTDILPDTPGLAERWGKTVLHCPYCHGFEIGGGSIGVLATGPMSVHQASLVADWGEVTLFTDDEITLDDAAATRLARRHVRVERAPVTRLEGAAPELDGVRLADGRLVDVRALFVATRIRMTSPLPAQLGCAFNDSPLGPIVRTDMWKQTTVAGVFAAGDMARVPHSISFACADGVTAGVGLHKWLVDDVSTRAA